MAGEVFFIGAGPGDPELLTIKGRRLLEEADVVIYAGSLVNRELLKWAKREAEIHDSSSMDRDTIVDLMVKSVKAGKRVARVHSGDPHIYGALKEQIDALKASGVKFTDVPGVSALTAAAAAFETELTLPDVSQTVIVTRAAIRTTKPESESFTNLAQHRSTMVIFTGIHVIDRIVKELIDGGYPASTPVGVVYKVTWPDEKIITGTLQDIVGKVREAKITKTALIVVGEIVKPKTYGLSKLYSPTFTHSYRRGIREEGSGDISIKAGSDDR